MSHPHSEPDATDPSDLDALVRRVDPDRWLSSRFIADPQARADVIAIYAYDHELARAPRVATNPLMGEIRLAWWREVLDEVFEGRHVRHHPTAQALAEVVRRRGLPREPLEAMIDGRYRQLDPEPLNAEDASALAVSTAGRANLLANIIIQAREPEYAPHLWSDIWMLSRLVLDGRIAEQALPSVQAEIRVSLIEARKFESVEMELFPAVAHATLASLYAQGKRPGELEKRLRLVWAVARGEI